MPSLTVPQAFALAIEHHRAGRLTEAETIYRQILVAQPDHAEAMRHLGLIAGPPGRANGVLTAIQNDRSQHPQTVYELANTLLQQGRLDEAIAAYLQLIALVPALPEAHLHLGVALAGKRRFEEAAGAFRRAIELKPNDAEAHNNLGNVLKDQGKSNEALTAYQEALKHKPDLVPALFNLGTALKDIGRLDEATAYFHRVLDLRPDHGGAWNNLGNTLQSQGKLPETEIAYRRALKFNPNHAEVYNNLANLQLEQGHPDEAIETFRHALTLRPDHAEAHGNLGNALKDSGRLDEAVAAYRRAAELWPTNAVAQSNLIFALHNHPNCNAALIGAEQRRWNQQFAAGSNKSLKPHLNSPDPMRCLRIGYVSADFRTHPVSFFTVPLMEAHDRSAVEIYCYSGTIRSDSVTERLRDCTDAWREVGAITDDELADRIHADRIDILVDLSMHTAGNRLLAFARKPAPVQVSWLAYPGTTGLDFIDYRLTDASIDPPGDMEEASSGGIPIRLTDVWCCYLPIIHFPEITPLPALNNGFVTFGSLNQFSKLNDEIFRCWTKLLEAVPRSRLILVCPPGLAAERVRALFAGNGIAPDRIELVPRRPWAEYQQLFEKVDVALDSYPCNGMTTTCHALRMGLPIVTLCGASAVSRAGASLLRAINMPQWIAKEGDEYIQIAAELARDIPRLAELRASLRQRLQSSPLMDAPRFARKIEGAYRAMWRNWCSKPEGIHQ